MDYAVARHNMVESQIRPNKVTHAGLIDVLEELPRELFVPKGLRGIAYVDEDIAVADGRYLMEPMVLARMLQLADVRPGDVALDIGCATGYSAAVLARLGSTVVAVESDEGLAEQAEHLLADLGIDNVVVVTGPLDQGYPKQAPYDVIFLGGHVDTVPEPLLAQLAEGGRLLAVVGRDGVGRATVFGKRDGVISRREMFDAAVRPLPGFETPPAFVF